MVTGELEKTEISFAIEMRNKRLLPNAALRPDRRHATADRQAIHGLLRRADGPP
jgi:hypothetical protein